jgi:hypothetical protein
MLKHFRSLDAEGGSEISWRMELLPIAIGSEFSQHFSELG